MIRLIIEKELRDIIGSTRFALSFGACALLILLAFYVGARNYQIGRERHEAEKKENVRNMEGLTDWNEVRSVRIGLPPQPISSLVMGVSNDIGRNTEVRGSGELTAEDSRYGEEPVFAVFRFLDLDFIFQIVLSLFAILFAYDAINGEKERGTLRLTFANPVPRAHYILGKMAGSFLALTVPLIVPVLLGALVLVLMGIPMQSSDWVRLAIIVVAGSFYLGAFLAITLFISAQTERPAVSFLISLVVWILSVMVLPRTAALVAGRAVEVPAVDELASKKSRYAASLWQEDRVTMANYRMPKGIPPDQMMMEFQKFMGRIGEERTRKLNEFAARLNEERGNRQRVQEQLALGLARLSPSATFALAATGAAGTGIHLKGAYQRAAIKHQSAFAEFIKGKTGQTPSGGIVLRITTDSDKEKKQPINPQELPQFVFVPDPLSASIAPLAVDLGILALFNLVFFAAAFVSFLRYDVR